MSDSASLTIEDLPEPLLLHILSFLYVPEAIQTSFLSRKFRNLWHLMPSLHFDIFEFYSRSTLPDPRTDVSRQLFVEFVSQALAVRPPSPLTKFVLIFESTNGDKYEKYVQKWIQQVTNSSVSELIIDFNDQKFHLWDDVDYSFYRDSNLTFYLEDIPEDCIKVLKIDQCFLMLPEETNPIKFVSLKSLEIASLCWISDEDVCNLLTRCVNLETLKLKHNKFGPSQDYFSATLKIYSTTLKELYLEGCSNYNTSELALPLDLDLDICCPNLRKISLINLDPGKYINKDTTLLVEAWVDFLPFSRKENYNQSWETMLRYFTNISSLHVWEELLESNEFPAGCEQLASNVKHLEVYCSYNEDDLVGLAALLKLLPKLEILGLHNRDTERLHNRGTENEIHRDYWGSSIVFNMPSLRKVILRKYQNTESERHFIELFKNSGIVLEKIVLLHASNREEDEQ